MAEENKLDQEIEDQEALAKAVASMEVSEVARLNDFIALSQQLKAKQDALDAMAADSTTSAIGSSYVADTLEPNSQGDLITLVADDPAIQPVIDNIFKRLNIPLEKVVYSLFKNGIAIAEFAHEADLVNRIDKIKPKVAMEAVTESATEGIERSATEGIKFKQHNSSLAPKLKILSDTTRVFPVLQYESVVGFIEVTLDDWGTIDLSQEIISYKDVILHSAEDYAYVKFGFRTESKPLQLKVKLKDGTIVEYDIDQGRSLLEAAYPAWQTLTIMKDSINLARLAYSASSVIVQTEVGTMTEAQIEVARNKLKDLFENRLAIGRNGIKSYLQPQIKPNYIYSFTSNGKGALTIDTVGGDYNPGTLADLKYFEDEYFGAMGAVKQHYARTEDGAGLDGGGAVEQYEKRYKSYVGQFKRLVAKFIKECINRVILSRKQIGAYDRFDVRVNKAYEEEDMSIVNLQTTKLGFLEQAINFMALKDENKLIELKLQALKTVISDKALLDSFTKVVMESPKEPPVKEENNPDMAEDDMADLGGMGGGGGGDLMDQIDSIGTEDENVESDLPEDTFDEEAGEGADLESGEGDELPAVGDIVDDSQIDE